MVFLGDFCLFFGQGRIFWIQFGGLSQKSCGGFLLALLFLIHGLGGQTPGNPQLGLGMISLGGGVGFTLGCHRLKFPQGRLPLRILIKPLRHLELAVPVDFSGTSALHLPSKNILGR